MQKHIVFYAATGRQLLPSDIKRPVRAWSGKLKWWTRKIYAQAHCVLCGSRLTTTTRRGLRDPRQSYQIIPDALSSLVYQGRLWAQTQQNHDLGVSFSWKGLFGVVLLRTNNHPQSKCRCSDFHSTKASGSTQNTLTLPVSTVVDAQQPT